MQQCLHVKDECYINKNQLLSHFLGNTMKYVYIYIYCKSQNTCHGYLRVRLFPQRPLTEFKILCPCFQQTKTMPSGGISLAVWPLHLGSTFVVEPVQKRVPVKRYKKSWDVSATHFDGSLDPTKRSPIFGDFGQP